MDSEGDITRVPTSTGVKTVDISGTATGGYKLNIVTITFL